jgi:hypothetical protein
MKNKNILIGLVGLGVLYALYMKNNPKEKKCKKWSTVNCIKAPCPPQCAEYK